MGFVDQATVVLFLAWFNEEFVEYFFGIPLEKKLPNLDRWFLRYVALATGLLWGLVFQVNIIGWTGAPEMPGRILTAILIGSSSQLLHKALETLRGN